MSDTILTPESIVTTTALVVALVFSYFPVLRVKFAALQPEAKSGIMIGLMVAVSLAVWGMGCAGWLASGLDCTKNGILELGKLVVIAIVTNQGVNRISPEPADVREAKQARS